MIVLSVFVWAKIFTINISFEKTWFGVGNCSVLFSLIYCVQ